MSDWLRVATKEDWDSYGGVPTTEAAIATARKLVGVSMSNGGVQIELHAGGWDIEIEIMPDGRVWGISCERGAL